MSFKIQILGSNSSLPAYGRHHTSQLVTVGNNSLLIDCGEGTQYQIQKFKVKASRINHIFISHLHGDHFLGLMGIIFSFHLTGRTKDLNIYGQTGLDEIIITQLRWSGSSLNYKLIFHTLQPDRESLILENKTITVHSIPLTHKIPCCGFVIKEKPKPRRISDKSIPADFPIKNYQLLKDGKDITDDNGNVIYKNKELTLAPKRSRSYAFCSDTTFDLSLADYIAGVDALYHEATFLEEKEKWARKTLHSTTKDAASVALKAKVGQLIIGHFSARYRDVEPFVEECKTIFSNTIPAIEGDIISIKE